MLALSDSKDEKRKSHFVPSNIVENSKLKEAPLCTVMVTFNDNQNKDVTSAYVFTTTTPQLYPQTRKTVFQYGQGLRSNTDSAMSFSSPPLSSDDSGFTSSKISPSNQVIQEISLSYSPPYTSTVRRDHKRPLSYSPNFSVSDRHYEKIGGAYSQNSNKIYSDFPAEKQQSPTPYFSAQSAIRASSATPVYTPPVTPSFNQSRALSQNTIVLESETFEELTTIVTSNSQSQTKPKKSTMPTVNALTKQFEATAQNGQEFSRHSRVASKSNTTQRNKSKSRVVVIDRQQKLSNQPTTWPAFVYSPGGILTTTIVDIEPAKFGRRTEEYKIQEEYIVRNYDNSSYGNQTDFKSSQKSQAKDDYLRKDAYENRENKELHVDTSPIDQVKNVVERFEVHTGGVKTVQDKQQRSVSRIDMNENNSKQQEKIILHQRNELVERVIPISPAFEKATFKSESLQQEKVVSPEPIVKPVSPTIMAEKTIVLEEQIFSPPLSIATPSPTQDTVEKVWHKEESEINQSLTTEVAVLENSHSLRTETTEKGLTRETLINSANDKEIDYVIKTDSKTYDETPATEDAEKPDTPVSTDYSHHILDRDYRIKTYEELIRTSRRREQSQPPKLTSPIPYSSLSTRSKSSERTWEGRFGGRLSRSYSEGRGLTSGAYGGFISGNLVSGMSSAGAICTSQIRDAREREKREIGILNDRLADYIEKVRFLEAQNQCLSHDIEILRRGFSGGGHVSSLFDSEIIRAKQILEQTIASQTHFERDINALSADIDGFRKKWLDSISAIKAHREDHDVDLDRLAKIEAEISLFKRKIRIVEEDVIRIRRENDGIYNEIARIRGLTHNEVALKNERRLNVEDLLQRIKLLETENSAKIEQELVFIRRDTTSENRDYFRHELQAAIRDIRADYEQISSRNRNEIEIWYREQIRKIQAETANRPNMDLYKEELTSIRSTVNTVKSRLAEVESRNFFLERLIADLKQSEEAKMYEISLAEKDAAIARLREQCTEISIQMEKLCDNEISLRAEIERYRILINGANVTTLVSNTTPHYAGATRVVSQTTRTHSSSNTSYTGIPASRSGGIVVGGNIGGIAVGGTIGGTTTPTAQHSGSVEKRPDRVHDDKGVDENGRSFRSWYLGTISINKVTSDFIELKNICKIRRVDVGGFKIEQSVNGSILGQAQILVPLILAPQETLKFYNANLKHLGQFFMEVDQFDTSVNARTSLYNYTEPEEERGWFTFLD